MGKILVTFEDIAESYEETLDEDRKAWIQTKIGEAVTVLTGICPKAAHIAQDCAHPKAEQFRLAVIQAVLRLVRDQSPGIRAETLGNYEYSKDARTASGNIWFPDAELAMLGCGKTRTAVGTVKVTPTAPYGAPPADCRSRKNISRGIRWWS